MGEAGRQRASGGDCSRQAAEPCAAGANRPSVGACPPLQLPAGALARPGAAPRLARRLALPPVPRAAAAGQALPTALPT